MLTANPFDPRFDSIYTSFMPTLTWQTFVGKWRHVELNERAAFNHLDFFKVIHTTERVAKTAIEKLATLAESPCARLAG